MTGILVVNAGSSSLKLRVLGTGDEVTAALELDNWDGRADAGQLRQFIGGLAGIGAVGQPRPGRDLRGPLGLHRRHRRAPAGGQGRGQGGEDRYGWPRLVQLGPITAQAASQPARRRRSIRLRASQPAPASNMARAAAASMPAP